MFILDTNVISEAMRLEPEPAVMAWLDDQDALDLYVTTVSLGEVEYGLRRLPFGARRSRLEGNLEKLLAETFSGRVLSFDQPAATYYGQVMSRRRALGRPIFALDAQIAAIARVARFAIATRNVRDFVECGVEIVNPFERSRS